jgi:hypothetical protein
MINDPEYPLYQMHRRFRQFLARRRFTHTRANSTDPRKELAGRVERLVQLRLERAGYHVQRNGYNAPWDLTVNGHRVEIKAATYKSGRYQAAIRNHQADLLIFACQAQIALHYFIIPAAAYAHTTNIAIWTPNPAHYTGQWSIFYNAWHFAALILDRPSPHNTQLSLDLSAHSANPCSKGDHS